jgi:hypothetical protein
MNSSFYLTVLNNGCRYLSIQDQTGVWPRLTYFTISSGWEGVEEEESFFNYNLHRCNCSEQDFTDLHTCSGFYDEEIFYSTIMLGTTY